MVILGRVAHGVYVWVNEYAGRPQKRRHGRWIRRETSRSPVVTPQPHRRCSTRLARGPKRIPSPVKSLRAAVRGSRTTKITKSKRCPVAEQNQGVVVHAACTTVVDLRCLFRRPLVVQVHRSLVVTHSNPVSALTVTALRNGCASPKNTLAGSAGRKRATASFQSSPQSSRSTPRANASA